MVAAPHVSTLPAHVGIIMDGNGRWATQQKLPRSRGHMEGVEAAKRVITACIQEGIQYLTLYAFSTENWKRPAREIQFIMALLTGNLRKHYDFYRENDVKIVHCGNFAKLSPGVQTEIKSVMKETKNNTAITVNLAINYGGRDEILRAVNQCISSAPELQELTEDDIEKQLDNAHIPPADLIIRTGGEQRLSNFLLWDSAYAELYFSDTLWPDWNKDSVQAALQSFAGRKRNFGART